MSMQFVSTKAPQQPSSFADSIFKRTYAFDHAESWSGLAHRVASTVADNDQQRENFYNMINDRIFIPGGRYLYSAGRSIFTNSNCYGFMVEDSREAWAQLLNDVTMCLSTGGGLGVNYSLCRPSGTPIKRMGGTASGPLALMQMVNEVARHVMSGGARRSALWAGLHWKHADIHKFIDLKDWHPDIHEMKAKHFEYPAPLDMTNISVIIDDEYLHNLRDNVGSTWALHRRVCEYMARTGEPAFRNQSRILVDDEGAITGNACQESTLHDRDTCNLGSIVMSRIKDLNHLEEITRNAIQFLYNGSLKASYPTTQIANVARKNRRIGLGIMGLHEWMLLNTDGYKWSDKLHSFMQTWKEVSNDEGKRYSEKLGDNLPVTTRAIAPTGTISIMAETTSGIEPMFCTAYKRRYQKAGKHYFQYVIDPTAKRLMDMGIPHSKMEDTYSLSADIERRLNVQSNVQDFVDQAISNTVNLPAYGTEGNNDNEYFAQIVQKYLPTIKGLTFYPNGSRAGQPLNPVTMNEAIGQDGVIYEEESERCQQGVCGL